MRWASRWAAGVGLVLFTHAAAAQTAGRVSLRWNAPDECPDDVQLVHQIEQLLAEPLPDRPSDALSLSVRVVVQGSPSAGYSAKLSFEGAQGKDERDLEHPSCDRLLNAVALVVALAIDPERVHANEAAAGADSLPAAPPEANAPLVLNTPPPAPKIEPTRKQKASPKENALRGARVAAHGAIGAGSLPALGTGLEAELGFHRGALRASVLGRYWLERNRSVPSAPNGSVDLGLVAFGARACWLPLEGAWQLAACVGGDLGSEWAQGSGFDTPLSTHARYSDVTAGVEVGWLKSHLAPEAGFELLHTVDAPRFGFTRDGGDGKVIFQPAWGFVAVFGLAFEL